MADAPMLHSGIWAKRMLDDLAAEGVPSTAILRRAGVPEGALSGETPVLPIDQVIAIFQAAASFTGDSALALHLAQRQNVRDAGLIAYVSLSEPTLRDAFTCMARFYGVFSSAVRFDLDRLETEGRLAWSYLVPVSVKRRQLVEWSAALFVLSARDATGLDLGVKRTAFSHPRKRATSEFEAFFGGKVDFDAGENALYFSRSQLDLPVQSADPRLAAVLRRCCEDALAQTGRQESPLMVELERAIADRLAAGQASVEIVAPAMGMSRRTLARRLSELNTTYKETLERVRRALADRYLADSDLSVTEIGFLLGYADTSSFSSAYRRWTGTAPGAMR